MCGLPAGEFNSSPSTGGGTTSPGVGSGRVVLPGTNTHKACGTHTHGGTMTCGMGSTNREMCDT